MDFEAKKELNLFEARKEYSIERSLQNNSSISRSLIHNKMIQFLGTTATQAAKYLLQ